MISFYLLWCLSYSLLMFWLRKQWTSVPISKSENLLDEKVSLLIPFRNEAKNVSRLIQSLKKLASKNLDILLIDDQSEDDSFTFFSNLKSELQQIQVLRSPGKGKKEAISFGVKAATGSIILTSDADCDFRADWVSELTSSFLKSEVQLVAGPVLIREDSPTFFQRFQQIEWASIVLLTNFSFQQKRPLMCSGANLAFRKSAFEEVQGYVGNEHLLSGDDEFLMKKIHAAFGEDSCIYLPNQSALVHTEAQPNWESLLNQRIRWAGKWKHHRSFFHAFVAILAFFIQLTWIASFWFFLRDPKYLLFLGLIWAMKVQVEKRTLGSVLESLGYRLAFWDFLVTSLVHPFYSVWVGFGSLRGKFIWKGRSS